MSGERTDEEVLASVSRGAQGALQVRRCQYKGKSYVDVRAFFLAESGELRPSPKGVTLKNAEELAAVIEALSGASL